MTKPKAIAVVGPTSSGKTSLSIEIAKKFDGEVISADSRQVYKGLDLGTGKVTSDEMDGVPHHLLDIADPTTSYNAAEFELDASAALLDIQCRGRLPIIAGGTFFYLDMLRGRQQVASVPPDQDFRLSLMGFSTPELFEKLKEADPKRAETIDPNNRPRLVRALEIIDSLGHVPLLTSRESAYDWLIIGVNITKLRLHQNIHKRLLERFKAGMVDEVCELHKNGLSYERMHDLGLEYRYIAMYLQQELTYDEMLKKLEIKIRQYAKRQMTWLKRDEEIEWFEPTNTEAIFKRIEEFLHNENS
ncbi:tRNA (adenosine(37)-N6)-dimethylallyltransferase MiaA [Candidatus Nomurabacteria bacterium]|nr:tRNA (adenosine(37)-N6)-dimethylallyltransferase MiaA [Candidatus Nomurabacteria bacterium]MCB9818482.1 tRNA (adenosine(37)-N6)-dimethylallyltransferase MiaA [Candidatus Nomurabacteria bacterium]